MRHALFALFLIWPGREGRTLSQGSTTIRVVTTSEAEEWWLHHEAGWQQGWTLEAGSTIDVHVEGAQVSGGGGALWLGSPSGVAWRVAGLAAWDATGRELPARFVPLESGFQVVVDAVGARWPLRVDPLYQEPGWEVSGAVDGEQLGESLAGAGDVNGDGYDDLLATAMTEQGRVVRTYLGGPSGPTLAPTTLEIVDRGMAAVGDLNGDGYDDVWLATEEGMGRVVYGSASGLNPEGTDQVYWMGGVPWGGAAPMPQAGDLTGDGLDDLVMVKWPVYDGEFAGLEILPGRPEGVTIQADHDLGFPDFGRAVGTVVADLDGDGDRDILLAGGNGREQVLAFVRWNDGGSFTEAPDEAWFSPQGWPTFNDLGGAGDIDGDGLEDLALFGGLDVGDLQFVRGGAGWPSEAIHEVVPAPEGFGYTGWPVALGDVNGDGCGDLVDLHWEKNLDPPAVRLMEGSPDGMVVKQLWTPMDGALEASVPAGDVNGDGFDDFAMATVVHGPYRGHVALFYGYADPEEPPEGTEGTEDTDGTEGTEAPTGSSSACGCQTVGPPWGWAAMVAAVGLLRRRGRHRTMRQASVSLILAELRGSPLRDATPRHA